MGCGGSKVDPMRVPLAAKLPPLLRRRLNEIRGRRNATPDATISEKRLLKAGSHDDDHSSPHRRRHSAAAAAAADVHDIDTSSLGSGEESVSERPLLVEASSPEPRGFKDEHQKSEGRLQEGKADDDMEKNDHDEGENNGEESDEAGRLSNGEISYLGSESPSFRVYCVNQSEDAKDDTDYKDDDPEQQMCEHDSAASVDSNEESMAMTKTKEKRKRGIRLKKPGAVNVRNLLNVTSCYNSHSRSRRSSPRLLAPNTAA